MAADTKTNTKNSVAEIFKSMDYGPAPEADNVAKVDFNTFYFILQMHKSCHIIITPLTSLQANT